MKRKLLSMLVLLAAVATGAWADQLASSYSSNATLNAVTVSASMEVTIATGVTVTINNGLNITSGTLTVKGPGTLVVNGKAGSNGYNVEEGEGGAGGTGGVAISGNITVLGGATVKATGGNGGNGGNSEFEIGGKGAQGGAAITGEVTIQDASTLEATGGNGGNGGNGNVEGGNGANGANAIGGTLNYKGGTVTADGGNGGSGGSGTYGLDGSGGSAGKAFTTSVNFVSSDYILTDGSNAITATQVTSKKKVVIAEGTPTGYNVTANLVDGAYWSTFYSNEGNYQAPEGTQVFAVNLNTSTAKITMTEISDRIAKSGEGVVLKKTTAGDFTMTLTETAPAGDFTDNSLQGTTAAMTGAAGNIYVLNKGSQGIGFYKLKSTGTIGANKAYLTYSGGGSSAPSFFGFDSNTTGIDATLVNSEKVNSVVYDLQGRKVAQPTKGLYIVNGKKVVIK